MRFYYATQTSERPFTLLLFANDPHLVPRHYRKYLESFFRSYFGLRSAPLRLRLRARGREPGGTPEEPDERTQNATLGRAPGAGQEGSDT